MSDNYLEGASKGCKSILTFLKRSLDVLNESDKKKIRKLDSKNLTSILDKDDPVELSSNDLNKINRIMTLLDDLEEGEIRDELRSDKPSEDKPSEDKPSEDKPSEDKPSEDKPCKNEESENDISSMFYIDTTPSEILLAKPSKKSDTVSENNIDKIINEAKKKLDTPRYLYGSTVLMYYGYPVINFYADMVLNVYRFNFKNKLYERPMTDNFRKKIKFVLNKNNNYKVSIPLKRTDFVKTFNFDIETKEFSVRN